MKKIISFIALCLICINTMGISASAKDSEAPDSQEEIIVSVNYNLETGEQTTTEIPIIQTNGEVLESPAYEGTGGLGELIYDPLVKPPTDSKQNFIVAMKYNLETGEQTLSEIPIIQTNGEAMESPGYEGTGDLGELIYDPLEALPATNDQFDHDSINISITARYPYRAIAHLDITYHDGTRKYATGFLMGKNKVITAAHVLRDATLGSAKSVYVSAGRNKDHSFAKATAAASSLYISEDYFASDKGADYDYAVIILATNLGEQTGWLGWTTGVSADTAYTITGYPIDRYGALSTDSGKPTTYNSNMIFNQIDARMGQGGSPMYDVGSNQVVGLHTHGSYGENPDHRATRWTSKAASFLIGV